MEQASDLSLPLIYRGVGYEYDILSNPLLQTNCFVRCRQRLVFVVLEFEFVVFRVPVGITLGYEVLMTSRNQILNESFRLAVGAISTERRKTSTTTTTTTTTTLPLLLLE